MRQNIERRRSPRISQVVPISILESGEQLMVNTENISASGAYCTVNRFIAPMTKLKIKLELPADSSKTSLTCEGVVVRAEPVIANPNTPKYKIAIFFSELTEHARSAISRYVQKHIDSAGPNKNLPE